MKKIVKRNAKIYTGLFLVLFFFGGQPKEFGSENTFFHGYLIKNPVIRVGIGVNQREMRISSSSGMKIYEVNAEYKLIAENTDEILIKGDREKLNEKFVIQVAQFKDLEKAEAFSRELQLKIKNKVFIAENSGNEVTGIFFVKIGDFLTRGDALNCIKSLNLLGINESWILKEDITKKEVKPLWILVNNELKNLDENSVLYFIPDSAQSFLSYKGRDYRGIFILRANRKGLVLINTLNIEDYLKSVVPSEFSPYLFNRIEAQKAQAVAARTYALKNLNSNEKSDFDLYDTPRSQFYKGLNAEHPLSSEAVEKTSGEVVLYKDKLIDALYTSTCGGRTENVEEIFQGPSLPYLRSTECVYEGQKEYRLDGEKVIFPIFINGKNIAVEVSSLICLGVLPDEVNPLFFKEQADFEESLTWLERALVLLGKEKKDLIAVPSPLSFLSLADLIINGFGWEERVENLFLTSEKDYILKEFPDSDNGDMDNLAYLVQEGMFPPSQSIGDPTRAVSRGELVSFLWKIMQESRDMAHEGIFLGLEKNKIRIEEKGEEKELVYSSEIFLLKNFNGDRSFASRVYLLGGERIRWIKKQDFVNYLEVLYPPNSNILDRSSSYHSWQIRKSMEDLERRVNRYYPIAELIDIIPEKRGDSKRVVELLIKGRGDQALVKGLRIRRVLGLKETLFVIDREYDEDGRITFFTFCGRGWGHGVGLCQVGAYGMALADAGYKEILKKYYQGISLSKIY